MSGITCRVCGERLERLGAPPVSCMACDTPYHVDCWSFNGGKCGVYACEGRRAMAGYPRTLAAPPVCPAPAQPYVWRRELAPLVATVTTSALLASVSAAACLVPWGGLYLALLAFPLVRLITDGLGWLRGVTVDRAGMTFEYLGGVRRSVRWEDVLRGPGAGDWTGAVLLKGGEVMVMPVGEPGFDEVLRRTTLALSRRAVSEDVFFIGEDA
ncbi:MAG: hypothetical protein HY816_21690 [Candidatus Wallbacteria bacterium]|nr:hypothetical protein [Candidatus Wallbacteria bacterium]